MITRVKVGAYEKALVYQNGGLAQILSAGTYWLPTWYEVRMYSIQERFNSSRDLDLLLQHDELKEALDIIEVPERAIAVQYKAGLFQCVLPTGRYAYWKSGPVYNYDIVQLETREIADGDVDRKVLNRSGFAPYVATFQVQSYETGYILLDGKYERKVGPGVYRYWRGEQIPTIEKVDMRMQSLDVSGQELLTKDKASIRVNFAAEFSVTDIEKAIQEHVDYRKQVYASMQLALRLYIGQLTLDELLANKNSVDESMLTHVQEKAKEVGVTVNQCGIKDVILPGDVKEIMNQVLVAEKKAQANLIMRREETASTRSLLNTAKLMEDNAMLYKLKEMEYVEKIAENIRSVRLGGDGRMIDQLRTIFSSK